MYHIKTLNINRLDKASFVQLLTETSTALADYLKKDALTLYTSKNQELKKLLKDYEAYLHTTRASKVSPKLEQADGERDEALTTLFALVRAYARVKADNQEEAYQKLSALFKNYLKADKLSYEKETEAISHLLGRLAKDTYKSAITSLHLASHVERLKTAQATFQTLYSERLKEQQQEATKGEGKTIRLKLEELYTFLVDHATIMAYAYPEKVPAVELRDQLNAIRSRYKKPSKKKVEKESTPA